MYWFNINNDWYSESKYIEPKCAQFININQFTYLHIIFMTSHAGFTLLAMKRPYFLWRKKNILLIHWGAKSKLSILKDVEILVLFFPCYFQNSSSAIGSILQHRTFISRLIFIVKIFMSSNNKILKTMFSFSKGRRRRRKMLIDSKLT